MTNKTSSYKIIVIGAGHAGIEAASICAKLGKKVALITLSADKIGFMHCNPSVGGPAKGIIVREIDALGGVMGRAADYTALQFKLLNSSAGPAIQALRVQSDKLAYSSYMYNYVQGQENITVVEDSVEELLISNKRITGVRTTRNGEIAAQVVILTTGTYLQPVTYRGQDVKNEGPNNEQRVVNDISKQLQKLGFQTRRFKTGTPPRILSSSIDFSVCKVEPGTNFPLTFSSSTSRGEILPYSRQLPCYLIHTNERIHELIRANLHLSPICYKEDIGKGPRYCPSVEDKILRFPDKSSHQVFLEPESLALDTTYLQGLSTSLPTSVQEMIVRMLPGLANCVIKKWGYAIEYDSINANQLSASLESKLVTNLFTAGQINGTSGYEEAAAQGIIAGINASRKVDSLQPLIIKRNEGYIGVLIDDLVTKENFEPYRLLTSRAEFRLLLRHDNVYTRLTPIAHQHSLVAETEWENFLKMKKKQETVLLKLKDFQLARATALNFFPTIGNEEFKSFERISLLKLLKAQKVKLAELESFVPEIPSLSWEEQREIEIEIVYEDYVSKQLKETALMHKYEKKQIPEGIDYLAIHNISAEAKEKLTKIRPLSIGQAARISGISPTDVQSLNLFLKNTNSARSERKN